MFENFPNEARICGKKGKSYVCSTCFKGCGGIVVLSIEVSLKQIAKELKHLGVPGTFGMTVNIKAAT